LCLELVRNLEHGREPPRVLNHLVPGADRLVQRAPHDFRGAALEAEQLVLTP
jgi:hypothetical protein